MHVRRHTGARGRRPPPSRDEPRTPSPAICVAEAPSTCPPAVRFPPAAPTEAAPASFHTGGDGAAGAKPTSTGKNAEVSTGSGARPAHPPAAREATGRERCGNSCSHVNPPRASQRNDHTWLQVSGSEPCPGELVSLPCQARAWGSAWLPNEGPVSVSPSGEPAWLHTVPNF